MAKLEILTGADAAELLSEETIALLARRIATGIYATREAVEHSIKSYIVPRLREHVSAKSDGLLAMRTEDGSTAGICTVKQAGTHPDDGKQILEIEIAVQEKHEGKGYASRLLEAAIERARHRNPDAWILLETKQDKLIAWCKRRGWKQITIDMVLRILKLTPGDPDAETYRSTLEKRNWQAFLLPPPQ